MNVDDLDLPTGIGSACTRQKHCVIDTTKIKELEEVNKQIFIHSWLQTNEFGEIENDLVTKSDLDSEKSVNSNSNIVATNKSKPTTTTSPKTRLIRLEEDFKVNLIPAGYKSESSKSNSSKSKKAERHQSKKLSETSSPNSKMPVVKPEMDVEKPSESTVKENDKFHMVPKVPSDYTDEGLDPSWEAIFNKKIPTWNNLTGDQLAKVQKNIRKAAGFCTCEKCDEEIPMELVHVCNGPAIPKEPVKTRRADPLLKADNSLIPNVMSHHVIGREKSLENSTMPLLTHGLTVPHPIETITQTNLISQVQQRLTVVGYQRCKPVQSYGWPGIMRRNNVVIINSHESGKTLAYVAPLSSMILDDDFTDPIDKSIGPALIVVANSSSVAEQVHAMFASFMKNDKFSERVWLAILPLSERQVAMRYRNGNRKTDILITTTDTLIALLHDRVFDLKRLRHIVFENVDIILDKAQRNFELIIDAVNGMISNRNSYFGVQFISTGERWTKKLEQFVIKLYNFPLIIIGNPMQAALYGRADLRLQYLEQKLKPEKLVELLKKSNYQIYKCIVVCKLDEIPEIEEQFSVEGIPFVTTTDLMGANDVSDLQINWRTTPNGKSIVLISTDKPLRSYNKISTASFLINYSLPPTWTLFIQRFSTLMESYICPLTSTYDQTKFNCKVVTYVDEKCLDRFPRISSFYEVNGIEIPLILRTYCNEQRKLLEAEKVNKNTKLCKLILLFGECTIKNCSDRHVFSKSIEGVEQIPTSGQITCRYINMKQPNYFNLQILEYKDYDGNVHVLEDYAKKVTQIMTNMTGFNLSNNIVKDGKYIYVNKDEIYRCVVTRIAKFVSIDSITTTEPSDVEIYGLDIGCKLTVSVDKLYDMPEELQNIPQTIVEVFLANIIPPFKQSTWTRNSYLDMSNELKDFNSENNEMLVVGSIVLRLNNTIWVDDLKLKNTEDQITKWFIVSKYLKKRRLYEVSDKQLSLLYELCKEAEISLPEYKPMKPVAQKPKFKQPKGCWAHLSADEMNLVFFSTATSSHSFYVKLTKYDDLLKQMEADIAESCNAIKRKLYDHEVVVDGFYAIADQDCGGYCRVLLTGIDKDQFATCFYLDYGDYTTVPVTCLKFLNNAFITKLPFQAIECSLYGVQENNCGLLLDTLYDYTLTVICAKYISEEQVVSSMGVTKKFKVVLIDYTNEEPKNINKYFLNAGIAEEIEDENLNDVEIPVACQEAEESNKEENWDESPKNSSPERTLRDEFEVIHDKMGHVEPPIVMSQQTKKTDDPTTTKDKTEYLPMKAVPSSDTIPPQIVWYQTEKEVFVEFVFLENNDYKININRNRFLNFSSIYKGKNYNITINLYDSVSKNITHESKTHVILLTLTKVKEELWPRFAKSEERMKNVKYKIDKIEEDSSDSEELRAEDDPRFFEHIEVSKDGVVHEYYSEIEESESDYNDSDEWD